MVRAGDRVDDREAEPVAAGRADALWPESLKRLEQAIDFDGRDDRARVADGQASAVGCGTGRDLNRAAGDVVADRVVEQVRDQARKEIWVAGRLSLVEGRVDLEAAPRRVVTAALDDVLG